MLERDLAVARCMSFKAVTTASKQIATRSWSAFLNVLSVVPKQAQDAVAAIVRTI